MPHSPYSCVLWDVDGTIVDASVGILRRLNVALTHFGRPAPTREELVHWIGPPMFQSFQDQAGMTPEQSAEAVAFYRTLGKADGYTTDAATYPGVRNSATIGSTFAGRASGSTCGLCCSRSPSRSWGRGSAAVTDECEPRECASCVTS